MSSSPPRSAAVTGILLMLLAIALLSTMDAMAKWLVLRSIDSIQILAVRSVIIVPLLILVYVATHRSRELVPTRPWAQALRGLTGIGAPLAFFTALEHLPLTNAVVVFFSSGFMTTLLSIVFLGERVGRYRWSAIVVGYLGVIVAIAPETGGDLYGYFLVLVSSFMYSLLFVSGKKLSATESVSSLVLFYNLGVGVVGLLALPWYWQPLDAVEFTMILALSAFAVTGHFAITHAFARTDASLIAPFEYSAVLWALLFDVVVWRVYPGGTTWLGALIIIGSGLFLMQRERARAARPSDVIRQVPPVDMNR